MRRAASLVFAAMVAGGCGPGLQPRIDKAMDQCLAVRNPQFKNGAGATALDTPLPAETDAIARSIGYDRALETLMGIAHGASTQAVLVCALEIGSRYEGSRTRHWLEQYTHHPSPDVATAATRLLAAQTPRTTPPTTAAP